MQKKFSTETFVGLVVVICTAFIVTFFYNFYRQSNATHTTPYYAYFERIDGLVDGAAVKVNGVNVGAVRGAELDPKTNYVKVAIDVRQDLTLPADSSALINSDGLLGGKYLSLQLGTDSETLKARDGIYKTQPPFILETLISHLLFSGSKDEKKADEAK